MIWIVPSNAALARCSVSHRRRVGWAEDGRNLWLQSDAEAWSTAVGDRLRPARLMNLAATATLFGGLTALFCLMEGFLPPLVALPLMTMFPLVLIADYLMHRHIERASRDVMSSQWLISPHGVRTSTVIDDSMSIEREFEGIDISGVEIEATGLTLDISGGRKMRIFLFTDGIRDKIARYVGRLARTSRRSALRTAPISLAYLTDASDPHALP